MPDKFQLLADAKTGPQPKAPKGSVVYECVRATYGCVENDWDFGRIKTKAVTLSPEGDYPFFTVETRFLKPLP